MRLLLDEHFPRRAAAELRGCGFDVAAITEDEELRGASDEALLAHARATRRAIVTQDIAGFSLLLREAALAQTEHFGVVFVPRKVWSSIRDLDRLVEALARFLAERPGDDALAGTAGWLEPPGA